MKHIKILQVKEQEMEETSETEKDGEHEKMIFSLVFNGNTDSGNTEYRTGNGFGQVMTASKNLEQSKNKDRKKLKIMKKIAKVINPLVYALFVIFYFVYYMLYFSQ